MRDEADYRWHNLGVDGGALSVAIAYHLAKDRGFANAHAGCPDAVKAARTLVRAVELLAPDEAKLPIRNEDYHGLQSAVQNAMLDENRTTHDEVRALIVFAGEVIRVANPEHVLAR